MKRHLTSKMYRPIKWYAFFTCANGNDSKKCKKQQQQNTVTGYYILIHTCTYPQHCKIQLDSTK